MKAPNKLFIKPEQIKVEMIPGGVLPNVGIQYIRKDLLLEWAEAHKVNCVGDHYTDGRNDAMDLLIKMLDLL